MLDALVQMDRSLGVWLASAIGGSAAHPFLLPFTFAGFHGAIWLLVCLVGWIVSPAKRMAIWRVLLAASLTGTIVEAAIKPTIVRHRPFVGYESDAPLVYRPTTSSFPSGHAASSGACAYALSRVWPRAAPVFWSVGAIIAFSRIGLGMHFPSDVVAGFLLGILVSAFVTGVRPGRTVQAHGASAPGF